MQHATKRPQKVVEARITVGKIQDVLDYEEAAGEQRTRTWEEPDNDLCDIVDTSKNPKT